MHKEICYDLSEPLLGQQTGVERINETLTDENVLVKHCMIPLI